MVVVWAAEHACDAALPVEQRCCDSEMQGQACRALPVQQPALPARCRALATDHLLCAWLTRCHTGCRRRGGRSAVRAAQPGPAAAALRCRRAGRSGMGCSDRRSLLLRLSAQAQAGALSIPCKYKPTRVSKIPCVRLCSSCVGSGASSPPASARG